MNSVTYESSGNTSAIFSPSDRSLLFQMPAPRSAKQKTVSKDNKGSHWHTDEGGEIIGIPQEKINGGF